MAKARVETTTTKKPNNEVVKAAAAALPSTEVNQTWGSEALDGQDMIIPKLHLMQGLSKKVASGEASVGQIRESLENKLMGGRVDPKKNPEAVEIIVFSTFKTWILTEKKAGAQKFEYAGTEAFTAENADRPRQGQRKNKEGVMVDFEDNLSLNYYVLTTKDIADGIAFPYVVSFRRTSMQAGKTLATMLQMMKRANKPSAANIFELNIEAMSNEKGDFFGFSIAKGRESTPQEVAIAKEWYDIVQKNKDKIKVDDSDLREENNTAPRAAAQPDANQDY